MRRKEFQAFFFKPPNQGIVGISLPKAHSQRGTLRQLQLWLEMTSALPLNDVEAQISADEALARRLQVRFKFTIRRRRAPALAPKMNSTQTQHRC